MTRHADSVVIRGLMTRRTPQAWRAEAVPASSDPGLVQETAVPLNRTVASGMTVDATRVQQDFAGLDEQRSRPLRRI
jgi:hypothetical protein